MCNIVHAFSYMYEFPIYKLITKDYETKITKNSTHVSANLLLIRSMGRKGNVRQNYRKYNDVLL